jgi:hypothetical protein
MKMELSLRAKKMDRLLPRRPAHSAIFYWNLFDRSTPEVPISSGESEDAAEEFDRSCQIFVLLV